MAQEVVTSLVGNVVDKLFGKVKEEISYMWNWSKNVKDLEKENKNLTLMRERVLELIKAAEEKGDRLLPGVEDWVVNAESHIHEAKEIIDGAKAESQLSEAKEVTGGANAEVTEGANTESHVSEDIEVTEGTNAESRISKAKEDIDGVEGISKKKCCNLGMCVNPGTCYSYGKKAAHMAPLLKIVQEEGKSFEGRVSVPTLPPGILDLYDQKNIDDFKTHKLCFNRIMESIIDDTKQIVGIYGIGGVGKTTLAKEVAVSPTVKSLFAAVEFITVSQPLDAERIKKEAENAANELSTTARRF